MPGTSAVLSALAAAAAVWWWAAPTGLARLPARGARGTRDRPASAADAVERLVARARRALVACRPAHRRRRERLTTEVAGVCTLLAVCLDSGRPPRAALRIVAGSFEGPTAELLADVLARIDLGLPEREAWSVLGEVPAYAMVAQDIGRAVDSGLHLADTLRDHARDARRRQATEALVRARTAGVRSVVPLMVCFLPAFLLLGVVPLFGAVLGRMAG